MLRRPCAILSMMRGQWRRALKELSFDVTLRENLDQKEMKKEIQAFGQKLQKGGVGLFYFAGHGVQVNGHNYLIPLGASIEHENQVEYEAVDMGAVLGEMDYARNRLNIVILDACRDNPFARSFRSASQGLASINAPSGTVISFATAPGSVANDGPGENGVFTGELVKAMMQPGLKIEDVFKQVRSAVREATLGKQVPVGIFVSGRRFLLPRPTAARPALFLRSNSLSPAQDAQVSGTIRPVCRRPGRTRFTGRKTAPDIQELERTRQRPRFCMDTRRVFSSWEAPSPRRIALKMKDRSMKSVSTDSG